MPASRMTVAHGFATENETMRRTYLPNLDQLRRVPLLAIRLPLFVLAGLLPGMLPVQPIEIESVLLAPIQEVEVPTQEAGLLQRMRWPKGR